MGTSATRAPRAAGMASDMSMCDSQWIPFEVVAVVVVVVRVVTAVVVVSKW